MLSKLYDCLYSGAPALYFSDIPEHKLSKSFTVKLPIDSWECTVRSIDVTPDGRILVVDRRIKLFDKDGNILDTLKIDLCFGPDIVAVTSDEEAVCTVTPDSEIYVINIKDNKLALKGTIRVSPRSWVSDISAHNDSFFIINGTRRCVSIQRIDKQGNICWSRQRDIQVLGQPLLKSQLHARLTSFIEEGKLKLVAVDVTDKRLIKLDGETGEVLMVTKLFDNGIEAPAEISHDGKQFLYVSHPVNKEIYTWNFELTECKMILSDDKGLHGKPSCLKYDAPNERLLVSYGYSLRNVIDIFHSVCKS